MTSIYNDLTARQLADLCGLSQVTSTSTGVSALCPEHADTKPSLRIDTGTDGPVAHCFACGYSAGALGLVQSTQADITTPADAARWLEAHIGTSTPPPATTATRITPPPAADVALVALATDDAAPLITQYASELAVTAQHLSQAGVAAGLAGARRVLRVPALDTSGNTVGYQDISTPDDSGKRTKLSAKGLPAPVWGLDTITPATTQIVLCEGVSDYLIARACYRSDDHVTVVGAAGAQVMTRAVQDTVAALQGQHAALCVSADGDKAGIDAAIAAATLWPTAAITILLPDANADLKDIHLANCQHATPEADEVYDAASIARKRTRQTILDAVSGTTGTVVPHLPAHQQPDDNHAAFATRLAKIVTHKWGAHADTAHEQAQAAADGVSLQAAGGLVSSLADIAAHAIDPDTGDDYDLWQPEFDEHGRLALLHHHATTLLVAPVALLGMVLAEHAASVAHNWVLPPRTGNNKTGAGSPLVLYVCLAAPPGSGKTEAAKQAKAIIDHRPHTRDTTSTPEHYYDIDTHWPIQRTGTPTSGEAFAEQLIAEIEETLPDGHPDAGTTRKIRRAVRHRARWHYGELDQLLITAARSSSILLTMLRQAWSGEELATTNATSERSRRVPQLTYSMGISALAQFEPAGELLAGTARGDAQRWLWLPNAAPYSPDAEQAASDAAQAHGGALPAIPLTHWQLPPQQAYDGAHSEITVDPSITRHIVAAARATLHGTAVPDEVAAQDEITGADTNKHTNQMRLRIAVAAARLCDLPPAVTPDLWRWAGALLSIDRQTRELLEAEGIRTAAATRDQQRQARTDDRVHATDAEHDKAVARIEQLVGAAAHSIASYADRHDRTVTAGEANRALAGSQRAEAKALAVARTELRDLAIDLLLDEGYLTVCATDSGDRYQLTDSGHAKLHE